MCQIYRRVMVQANVTLSTPTRYPRTVNNIDYIPRQRTAVSNSPPPSLLTARASPNLSCIRAASVHNPNNTTNSKYDIDVVAIAHTVPEKFNEFNDLR